MKKRYSLILFFLTIGLIIYFQLFVIERSEYVAGEDRHYTLYERHFNNDPDYFGTSAFKNDKYNLEKIIDEIWVRDHKSEEVRKKLKFLYDKLKTNVYELNEYKLCIDTLEKYEKHLSQISTNLSVDQRNLLELKTYISENENQVRSRLQYSVKIDFYYNMSIGIDSLIGEYSGFTNKLSASVQELVFDIESEIDRRETERRLARQKEFEKSLKLRQKQSRSVQSYSIDNNQFKQSTREPRRSIDHYTNSFGESVQSPTHYNKRPKGATAICNDGTYSFSRNRRGTCSGHGGVKTWLR
tara:strand:+ start:32088 stop:32981 length:894 start_codon:yes stop_codon:yes gene_type:complete